MSAARRQPPAEASRRGWCPSLARPMPTGDGLLARVHPPLGILSAVQLRAVAEAARRSNADRVLAAGDSLLDADLLLHAHAGIAARHGELVTSGWQAANVTVTAHHGIRAGEEIVAWLSAQVELSRSRVGPA